MHIFGCNVERHNDGVFFDTNGGGTLINGSMHTSGTSMLRINTGFPVLALNLVRSIGTNIIRNDRIGQNITLLRNGFYFNGYDTAGQQVLAMGGATQASGNVVGDNHPIWRIRSVATSGAASRSSLQWQDGNDNGWQMRFEANSARVPLTFFPITAGTLSSSATNYIGGTGYWAIPDGLTAPSADPGYALSFVDTADGDIKVRFGDGITKVISTDSTGAGTFTSDADASTTISDSRVLAASNISFAPTNAAAGLLVRTKTCYVDTISAGSFNFNVSSTGAGAPAGTETFSYVVYPG